MKRLLFFVALVAMMAVGCQESHELFDDIINPGQTPSDDNNVNEETIDLLTPDATFVEIPYDEIWYVASEELQFYGDSLSEFDENMIVSHVWDAKTGRGVVQFNKDLTTIPSNLFKDNISLEQMTIPSSVTEIGDSAFEGCSKLASVVIPEGVKSVGNRVFASCASLEKVTIGFDVGSIGEFAFYSCPKLKSVFLMCKYAPAVGDNLFSSVDGTTLYIPRGQKDAYMQNGAWGVMDSIMEEYDYRSLFTGVNLGEGTYIEDFFTWLYGVEGGARVSVEIYERVIEPGCYYMKNLFSKENVEAMLGEVPSDMVFTNGDTYIVVDASKAEEVYIPWQYAGFGIQGYMDQVYIASCKSIGAANAKLENGKIVFPAMTVALLDASSSGYYTNQSGLMAIALPGYKIPDYKTEVAYVGGEIAPDNSRVWAKFNVSIGEDVTKYRYVVVEGNEQAYTTITEGTLVRPVYRKEWHPAITAMLNAEYINGKLNLDSVDEEYRAYLEYSAESDSTVTEIKISLPKQSLYTIFVVPYDENGAPIKDNNGLQVVARTYFYYIPLGSNEPLPDLCDPVLKLASITEILTAGITNPEDLAKATEYYENAYPSCFYLGFDIQTDDADYVSQLVWYYTKTADLPEGVDPYTLEGQKTLINNHAGEDADISYQIEYLKDGRNPMVISATPDTEYTVVLSMTSIYGKTSYYTVTGRTTPYSFNIAFGTYSFVDGNSKMTIEFEPSYSATEYQKTGNGELFYMKWIVEDGAPDVKVREYSMVAFKEPDRNAIVCYGQLASNKDTYFGVDMGSYGIDPNAFWGFHSSSTANYASNNEPMVLHYNEDGVIDRLDTYFREYVRVENPDTGVSSMMYVKEFTPNTVITCIEDKRPNHNDEW